MAESATPYHLSYLPHVKSQLIELMANARDMQTRRELAALMRQIVKELHSNPREWGEAKYDTKNPGGTVYLGIRMPIIVQYVVYEHQRQVIVLQIKPFPT